MHFLRWFRCACKAMHEYKCGRFIPRGTCNSRFYSSTSSSNESSKNSSHCSKDSSTYYLPAPPFGMSKVGLILHFIGIRMLNEPASPMALILPTPPFGSFQVGLKQWFSTTMNHTRRIGCFGFFCPAYLQVCGLRDLSSGHLLWWHFNFQFEFQSQIPKIQLTVF